MKKGFLMMMCLCMATSVLAQKSVESIRKEYQAVHEWIAQMTPNEEGVSAMTPEYYDLHVVQNLPATGPHKENIRMFFGEEESEEDVIYPPHYLRFATAKYNFAARQFYEEYLYDDKGQVMFIYAITPDVDDDMVPYELRMWFDGKRLLRFMVKKAENPDKLDYENLQKGPYKEVYSGTTIPEQYRREANRCQERAGRFLTVFKSIDDNTYL